VADGAPGGLWATVQPWVQGLIGPGLVGTGVSIRWWWEARQKAKADDRKDEEARREEADDYRLKDRAQISAEQESLIKRQAADIVTLRTVVEAREGELKRVYGAFYRLHEWIREQRHNTKGLLARFWLDWQAGKPSPETMPQLAEIPPPEKFLEGQP
jgi:hypothetical protein